MKPIYLLSPYLLNKTAVSLNNGLNTAPEPGAGTPAHVPVHSGEYLRDGGHQAGFDAIGMSLKFAPDKIAHQNKIWARFGRFFKTKSWSWL